MYYPIIGITGQKRSGKDTAAEALTELGWVRMAFADPLKEALYALNPVLWTTDDGFPERVAEVVDELGWENAKGLTEIRRLLQRLGTEVGRGVFGEGFWVDQLVRRVHDEARGQMRPVVVTDVRFPNEADLIRSMGGIVVRVTRPGLPKDYHPSETAMDSYAADYRVANDGTVDALKDHLRGLADQYRDAFSRGEYR